MRKTELLQQLVELLDVVPFQDDNGNSTTSDLIETIFYSQNFNWLVENKLHETKQLIKALLTEIK